MGFSNSVIQKAIKEQMRTGRAPDLNRIKREQQEAERRGQLLCRWDKDRQGRLCYLVYMQDLYGKDLPIHRFHNVSRSMAGNIQNHVTQYSRMHRALLSQVSRLRSTDLIKRIQKDLDGMVYGNER